MTSTCKRSVSADTVAVVKTSNSGVRLIHRASGAVGEGRDHRTNTQNRKDAFLRCINTKKFKDWHKIECAKRMGQPVPETPEQVMARVDKMIEQGLRDGTIKVEELIERPST